MPSKTFSLILKELKDHNNEFYKDIHNRLGFLISIYGRAITLYIRILKNTSDDDSKRNVKNLTDYFESLKERFVFLGKIIKNPPDDPYKSIDRYVFTGIVDCVGWSDNLRLALLRFVSRSRKSGSYTGKDLDELEELLKLIPED